MRLLLAAVFCFLSVSAVQADVILFEDFEDNTVVFTASQPLFHDGTSDYFHIVPLNGAANTSETFSGFEGSNFFAAEDIDDGNTKPSNGTLSFNVNVTGVTDLSVDMLFAAGGNDTSPSYDSNDGFLVRASLDGGAVQNLLAFEAIGTTNELLRQDTDFDGTGDPAGFLPTEAFTAFNSLPITGTGDNLLVEVSFDSDDGNGEFAIDSFTINGTPSGDPKPIVTSHASMEQLAGEVDTFSWNANGAGDEFWVWIGDEPGAYNYYNSGSLGNTTTVNVNGLPTDGNSEVWLRLWFRAGSEDWGQKPYNPDFFLDVQYIAGSLAAMALQIVSPTPPGQLTATEMFEWSDPMFSLNYWIYAGSKQGARDYYNSGNIEADGANMHEVLNLPGGPATVWIRLWYRADFSSPWEFTDSQYGLQSPPTLSPGDGLLLSGSQQFALNDPGLGITEWWLHAGSTPGGFNVANSKSLAPESTYTVSDISQQINGRNDQLYIRLWYKVGTADWLFEDFVYTTLSDVIEID